MHISRVQLVNYRNFANATFQFNAGINTVIGENGSGKTNLFRAIRLMLDDDMLRWAHKLDDGDFHRGLGDWRGHWIIISLEFSEVSQDEAIQALFLHGTGVVEDGQIGIATYNLIFRPNAAIRAKLGELEPGDKVGLEHILKAISIDDYESVFTGKSTADFSNPDVYRELVGDFQTVEFPEELSPPEIGGRMPAVLSVSKEVCFTFVQALRDVVSEFQGQRTNPLLTLLRGKSGELDSEALDPVTERVNKLNEAIESLSDVGEIRSHIRETIRDAAGEAYSPARLTIRSGVPTQADKLFQSLKLFVGETDEDYEGAIHELSLGGANLIFLTLKLLEFKYQQSKRACANFLLIEEPEAHIHTHIQKTLFDKLSYPDTQVIYSTHSTQISEVSNIENVNILGRNGGRCEAYQPAAGLTTQVIRSIQRYLDAVRSNLLFAKSVLLVEGDAEEILIPALIKEVYGVSLDELGISIINIRSTGFENVGVLFHDQRIRKRCAIITDLDAAYFDIAPDPLDTDEQLKAKKKAERSQNAGMERRVRLNAFVDSNDWLSLHFAPHTFEVDFIGAGNAEVAVAAMPTVYVDAETIATAIAELRSTDPAAYGTRIITMAKSAGKGWFAIQLAKLVTPTTNVPKYITEAVFTAHGRISRSVAANMVEYRMAKSELPNLVGDEYFEVTRALVQQFRVGQIDTQTLVDGVAATMPGDAILDVLGYA